MSQEHMKRVSKREPCPVCGKSDWCLVAPDKSAAICPRTPDGSVKEISGSGFLHVLRDRHDGHNGHGRGARRRQLLKTVPASPGEVKDFGQLAMRYEEQMSADCLGSLAHSLGVTAESLQRLNVGWDGKAWTFPMSNDFGKTIGIRRRFPNGQKVSVKGGKTGLFIPSGLPVEGSLLLCEGPSDTAAALDLVFAAVGRPNCNSRTDMVLRFVKGRNVIVVADNDRAGKGGAEKLATRLALHCPSVKIVFPPHGIKDLRCWLASGLTVELMRKTIAASKPIGIKLRFKQIGTGTEANNG